MPNKIELPIKFTESEFITFIKNYLKDPMGKSRFVQQTTGLFSGDPSRTFDLTNYVQGDVTGLPERLDTAYDHYEFTLGIFKHVYDTLFDNGQLKPSIIKAFYMADYDKIHNPEGHNKSLVEFFEACKESKASPPSMSFENQRNLYLAVCGMLSFALMNPEIPLNNQSENDSQNKAKIDSLQMTLGALFTSVFIQPIGAIASGGSRDGQAVVGSQQLQKYIEDNATTDKFDRGFIINADVIHQFINEYQKVVLGRHGNFHAVFREEQHYDSLVSGPIATKDIIDRLAVNLMGLHRGSLRVLKDFDSIRNCMFNFMFVSHALYATSDREAQKTLARFKNIVCKISSELFNVLVKKAETEEHLNFLIEYSISERDLDSIDRCRKALLKESDGGIDAAASKRVIFKIGAARKLLLKVRDFRGILSVDDGGRRESKEELNPELSCMRRWFSENGNFSLRDVSLNNPEKVMEYIANNFFRYAKSVFFEKSIEEVVTPEQYSMIVGFSFKKLYEIVFDQTTDVGVSENKKLEIMQGFIAKLYESCGYDNQICRKIYDAVLGAFTSEENPHLVEVIKPFEVMIDLDHKLGMDELSAIKSTLVASTQMPDSVRRQFFGAIDFAEATRGFRRIARMPVPVEQEVKNERSIDSQSYVLEDDYFSSPAASVAGEIEKEEKHFRTWLGSREDGIPTCFYGIKPVYAEKEIEEMISVLLEYCNNTLEINPEADLESPEVDVKRRAVGLSAKLLLELQARLPKGAYTKEDLIVNRFICKLLDQHGSSKQIVEIIKAAVYQVERFSRGADVDKQPFRYPYVSLKAQSIFLKLYLSRVDSSQDGRVHSREMRREIRGLQAEIRRYIQDDRRRRRDSKGLNFILSNLRRAESLDNSQLLAVMGAIGRQNNEVFNQHFKDDGMTEDVRLLRDTLKGKNDEINSFIIREVSKNDTAAQDRKESQPLNLPLEQGETASLEAKHDVVLTLPMRLDQSLASFLREYKRASSLNDSGGAVYQGYRELVTDSFETILGTMQSKASTSVDDIRLTITKLDGLSRSSGVKFSTLHRKLRLAERTARFRAVLQDSASSSIKLPELKQRIQEKAKNLGQDRKQANGDPGLRQRLLTLDNIDEKAEMELVEYQYNCLRGMCIDEVEKFRPSRSSLSSSSSLSPETSDGGSEQKSSKATSPQLGSLQYSIKYSMLMLLDLYDVPEFQGMDNYQDYEQCCLGYNKIKQLVFTLLENAGDNQELRKSIISAIQEAYRVKRQPAIKHSDLLLLRDDTNCQAGKFYVRVVGDDNSSIEYAFLSDSRKILRGCLSKDDLELPESFDKFRNSDIENLRVFLPNILSALSRKGQFNKYKMNSSPLEELSCSFGNVAIDDYLYRKYSGVSGEHKEEHAIFSSRVTVSSELHPDGYEKKFKKALKGILSPVGESKQERVSKEVQQRKIGELQRFFNNRDLIPNSEEFDDIFSDFLLLDFNDGGQCDRYFARVRSWIDSVFREGSSIPSWVREVVGEVKGIGKEITPEKSIEYLKNSLTEAVFKACYEKVANNILPESAAYRLIKFTKQSKPREQLETNPLFVEKQFIVLKGGGAEGDAVPCRYIFSKVISRIQQEIEHLKRSSNHYDSRELREALEDIKKKMMVRLHKVFSSEFNPIYKKFEDVCYDIEVKAILSEAISDLSGFNNDSDEDFRSISFDDLQKELTQYCIESDLWKREYPVTTPKHLRDMVGRIGSDLKPTDTGKDSGIGEEEKALLHERRHFYMGPEGLNPEFALEHCQKLSELPSELLLDDAYKAILKILEGEAKLGESALSSTELGSTTGHGKAKGEAKHSGKHKERQLSNKRMEVNRKLIHAFYTEPFCPPSAAPILSQESKGKGPVRPVLQTRYSMLTPEQQQALDARMDEFERNSTGSTAKSASGFIYSKPTEMQIVQFINDNFKKLKVDDRILFIRWLRAEHKGIFSLLKLSSKGFEGESKALTDDLSKYVSVEEKMYYRDKKNEADLGRMTLISLDGQQKRLLQSSRFVRHVLPLLPNNKQRSIIENQLLSITFYTGNDPKLSRPQAAAVVLANYRLLKNDPDADPPQWFVLRRLGRDNGLDKLDFEDDMLPTLSQNEEKLSPEKLLEKQLDDNAILALASDEKLSIAVDDHDYSDVNHELLNLTGVAIVSDSLKGKRVVGDDLGSGDSKKRALSDDHVETITTDAKLVKSESSVVHLINSNSCTLLASEQKKSSKAKIPGIELYRKVGSKNVYARVVHDAEGKFDELNLSALPKSHNLSEFLSHTNGLWSKTKNVDIAIGREVVKVILLNCRNLDPITRYATKNGGRKLLQKSNQEIIKQCCERLIGIIDDAKDATLGGSLRDLFVKLEKSSSIEDEIIQLKMYVARIGSLGSKASSETIASVTQALVELTDSLSAHIKQRYMLMSSIYTKGFSKDAGRSAKQMQQVFSILSSKQHQASLSDSKVVPLINESERSTIVQQMTRYHNGLDEKTERRELLLDDTYAYYLCNSILLCPERAISPSVARDFLMLLILGKVDLRHDQLKLLLNKFLNRSDDFGVHAKVDPVIKKIFDLMSRLCEPNGGNICRNALSLLCVDSTFLDSRSEEGVSGLGVLSAMQKELRDLVSTAKLGEASTSAMVDFQRLIQVNEPSKVTDAVLAKHSQVHTAPVVEQKKKSRAVTVSTEVKSKMQKADECLQDFKKFYPTITSGNAESAKKGYAMNVEFMKMQLKFTFGILDALCFPVESNSEMVVYCKKLVENIDQLLGARYLGSKTVGEVPSISKLRRELGEKYAFLLTAPKGGKAKFHTPQDVLKFFNKELKQYKTEDEDADKVANLLGIAVYHLNEFYISKEGSKEVIVERQTLCQEMIGELQESLRVHFTKVGQPIVIPNEVCKQFQSCSDQYEGLINELLLFFQVRKSLAASNNRADPSTPPGTGKLLAQQGIHKKKTTPPPGDQRQAPRRRLIPGGGGDDRI